jgi:hypothetical protein
MPGVLPPFRRKQVHHALGGDRPVHQLIFHTLTCQA